MEAQLYDICVVGAGLVGSAVAKYVTESKNLKVVLIGPEEPKDVRMTDNVDGIASCWDEARKTRRTEIDPIIAALSQRSTAKYRDIEEKSGISFYNERGYISIADKDHEWIKGMRQAAKRDNIHTESLTGAQYKTISGYQQNIPDDAECLYERTGAGIINPRRLVAAQIVIAESQGCDIIRDVVVSINRVTGQDRSTFHRLETRRGVVYIAAKVVLTTGVSLYYNNLIDHTFQLKYTTVLFTCVKCEISQKDAKALRHMPCIDYNGDGYPGVNGPYRIVPPIEYPDGKYFMKISRSETYFSRTLRESVSLGEMKNWHNGEGIDFNIAQHMVDLCCHIFPGIRISSWHVVRCSGMVTPTCLPYIDFIEENKAVVFGDQGESAKWSDELGLIASRLILNGTWSYDLPATKFSFIRE